MQGSVHSILRDLIRFCSSAFSTFPVSLTMVDVLMCVQVGLMHRVLHCTSHSDCIKMCARATQHEHSGSIFEYLLHLQLMKSQPLCRMSLIRHCDLVGVRIGEASNPGPMHCGHVSAKKADLRLAVCNPTALYGKVSECLQLNADIICVSETSSTVIAQKALSSEFANFGYRCFWSKEVQSLKTTDDHRPSFRGEASGTAILTRILARQPRLKIPDILANTCRFTSAIFSVSSMDVLVISLYGFAKKIQEGKRMNDLLFALVHQVISQVNIPFIIAGDFNEPPQKLPIYKEFLKIGVVEAFEYYENFFGGQLPATCRGATRNDTAIIHHSLIPLIKGMHVQQDYLFDSHAPLFIDFDLSASLDTEYMWRIPQSWAPLCPKREFIEENYQGGYHKFFQYIPDFQTIEEGDEYLLQWSKAVEYAVDKSLKQQHLLDPVGAPFNGIPDQCRGRCRSRTFVPISKAKTVRDDKHGGFNPPCEVLSLKSKLKIRQVRRLQSLLRALKSSLLVDTRQRDFQLQTEWDVIKRAKGFGRRWDHWILAFDPISFVPDTIPIYEDLELMMHITRMDCESTCWLEQANKKKKYDHKIKVDAEDNFSRFTYSIIKGQHAQPLHEVPVTKTCDAKLLRSTKGKPTIVLLDDVCFRVNDHALFGDTKIRILSQHRNIVQCEVMEGILPSRALLQQQHFAIRNKDIFHAFSEFWNPMWNRDSVMSQTDPGCWSDILQDIDATPLPCASIDVNILDVELWKSTISKLGLRKAHGICGWRYEELKLLPDCVITHLAQIFQRIFHLGGSRYLMTARTHLLPKISRPESMNHVRPITILSCLYRLASKLLADQIGLSLSKVIPLGVSGGLPGRGVKDMALIQKLYIEDALTQCKPLCGFSLDLIKAFNTFPRLPMAYILQRLGIPTWVTKFWSNSLSRLVRHPQHQGALGVATPSTTGVPEGDGMSVIAMICLSTYFYVRVCTNYTFPFAYADNWSFFTSEERELHRSFRIILALTSSLKISIDFRKSWFCATSKNLKQSCKMTSLYFPGGDVNIPVLNEVKDLGEQVHYKKSMTLGFVKDKFVEGEAKINRIAALPTTIDHKARLIQSAVWPYALYTADTNYVGATHISKLRRAAINALVGEWNNTCPWLLGLVLSKHLSDPFVFILQNILRHLRRLASIRIDLAKKFIQMTCEHTSVRAWGPASALHLYLGRVGWKLNLNGILEISPVRQIDLLSTSTREIATFVSEVWPDFVITQINRKGIGNYQIHSGLTIKAFQSIPQHLQKFVALTMVGGFQTESQKMKWAADSDGSCPLCEQKDCHRHSYLDCPCLAECRKEHEEAISILEFERPEWVYFPIARKHSQVDELAIFVTSVTLPEHPPPNPHEHQHRVFYTDGGCQHPTDRFSRLASWSIVEDLSEQPLERQEFGSSTNLSFGYVPKFSSIGLGIVTSKQTASRGELTALTMAILSAVNDAHCESADFYVDAQYLLNLISTMENSTQDDWFFKKPNADLLKILCDQWPKKQFQLHKLKSHRNVADANDAGDMWNIVGNGLADTGATAALKNLPPFIQQLSDKITIFHKQELSRLKKVLQFMVVINSCRLRKVAELRTNKKDKESVVVEHSQQGLMPSNLSGDDIFDFLGSFHHPEYCSIPQQAIDEQCFHACFQGANIAKAVAMWCYTLKWPSDINAQPNYKRKDDWGISWLELFFNFAICTRFFFPIRTEGRSNDSTYIDYNSEEAFLNHGSKRAANMQTLCMERLIRALEKLQQIRLFPVFNSNQCKSLLRFGYTGKHTGVPCRPLMHRQGETMVWLKKFLVKARYEGHLGQPPILPEGEASIFFEPLVEVTSDQRWKNYYSIKGKQRRERMAIQG